MMTGIWNGFVKVLDKLKFFTRAGSVFWSALAGVVGACTVYFSYESEKDSAGTAILILLAGFRIGEVFFLTMIPQVQLSENSE